MVRNENGMLAGYVFVTSRARRGLLRRRSQARGLPEREAARGYHLAWSGQYENMLRVRDRLKLVLP